MEFFLLKNYFEKVSIRQKKNITISQRTHISQRFFSGGGGGGGGGGDKSKQYRTRSDATERLPNVLLPLNKYDTTSHNP